MLQTLDTNIEPSVIDDIAIDALVQGAIKTSSSNVYGRDAQDIIQQLNATGRRGPARMLDFMLQTGPYGAGFGTITDGLSLQKLLDNPHGVDLGELEPRIPEILRTTTGMVELCPSEFRADLARLFDSINEVDETQMLLIGRRHLKTNNSWMHNINVLTKGNVHCTLQVHPDDARRLGLSDGSNARVTSRVGTIDAPVEVTESIRRGVVSLPHGWGHDVQGTLMRVAAKKAGVNSNVLTDSEALDPLSGTSALNAIPVVVLSSTRRRPGPTSVHRGCSLSPCHPQFCPPKTACYPHKKPVIHSVVHFQSTAKPHMFFSGNRQRRRKSSWLINGAPRGF